VPVVRKGAEIVHAHPDPSLRERAAQNPVFEDARKKSGKDGDDLESHTH